MNSYPYQAKMYLREARDAFEKLKIARDGDDLNRGLILFLEATKHSTIQLQSGFRGKIEGFDKWWINVSKALKADSICKFFYTLRNRVVKAGENVIALSFTIKGPVILKGPLQINSEGVMLKKQKGSSYEWVPKKDIPGMKVVRWRFHDYPEGHQGGDSLILCETYLNKLETVVDDFVTKFGNTK